MMKLSLIHILEYQGDGNKAIFYYIADERVDFRQLIKVLADTCLLYTSIKQVGRNILRIGIYRRLARIHI